METAAITIQRAWRNSHGECTDCQTTMKTKMLLGWKFGIEPRCADCYWDREEEFKRQRRYGPRLCCSPVE